MILNPLFLSIYGFFIIAYKANLEINNPSKDFGISAFFIAFLPLITVYILMKNKMLSDVYASDQFERKKVMIFGVVYCFLGFISLKTLNSHSLIAGQMFCSFLNAMILWIITYFWKISIHSTGISSIFSMLILINHYNIPLMFLLVFCVSLSRIVLKAHTPLQIIAGLIIGFIFTAIPLKLFFI
tara:strand:- start:238 stop:789 length:552 start_codon:yes stop_codon:yes gene_type:complete